MISKCNKQTETDGSLISQFPLINIEMYTFMGKDSRKLLIWKILDSPWKYLPQ